MKSSDEVRNREKANVGMNVGTIAKELLFGTLRVRAYSAEGTLSVGTAFIVSHRWSEENGGLFLVTNKHVIDDTTRGKLTFTAGSLKNGKAPLGSIVTQSLSGEEWNWTTHPSPDIDVAVLSLGQIIDGMREKGLRPFYRFAATTLIPRQEELEALDAVENILFVGYPQGMFDRVHNLPVFRRGITATVPSVDYDGMPVFLVDGSVFPGSSGSPVFVYDRVWRQWGRPVSGERLVLLGVLAGACYRTADGELELREAPTRLRAVVRGREMIDLGVVYKGRTIVETIEHLLREVGYAGVPFTVQKPPSLVVLIWSRTKNVVRSLLFGSER